MTGRPPAPARHTTSNPLGWAVTVCGTLAGLAIAWAVATGWSTPATCVVVGAGAPFTLAALFLVCLRISAALTPPGRTTSPRPRLAYRAEPRSALVVIDTPLPTCPACLGHGGWNTYISDGGSAEDGETLWQHCPCWNPRWVVRLVPLPRLVERRRGQPSGYSDEPPF
ncbi:hypothetical protein [Actinacidiphila sp. ITFR-21]|uniref:hypothetical protein n=1 Tax=Actinacidiphila sp. ITFR-21 TaxID=3075199 RepID=UPI002889F663|nr:hypothetical protein [Streptomyces sp. ITFR-21]WNI16638.1 hypothetical protein RLT57_14700 [Streptomyces sp. ITFR-21]